MNDKPVKAYAVEPDTFVTDKGKRKVRIFVYPKGDGLVTMVDMPLQEAFELALGLLDCLQDYMVVNSKIDR